MKRTQIYLPEELHYELGYLAKLQNSSISEIIRKTLKQSLKKQKGRKKSAYAFFDYLIKQGKKYGKNLPRDLSTRHTEYYIETVIPSQKSKSLFENF
ncbi:MAG TPA: CopG family transcriptional regulator [Patescibacteria group bacterium]|nr:CopG family transcriptional regulator [Patescibacteria group bacterium]